MLFLNVELLSEFYYNFPRELDARLGRGLAAAQVDRFAREDPRVARHLDCVRRKELLELVLGKVEGVRGLEGRREGGREMRREEVMGGKVGGGKERARGWGLF